MKKNNILIFALVASFFGNAYSKNINDIVWKLSDTIRNNQAEIIEFNKYLESLQSEQQEYQKNIKKMQQNIAKNVITILKLNALPQELMLSSNIAKKNIALTYIITKNNLKIFIYQIEKLNSYISEINKINKSILQSKENLTKVNKNLKQTKQDLLHLLKKNGNITTKKYNEIEKMYKQSAEIIAIFNNINKIPKTNEEKRQNIIVRKAKGHFAVPINGNLISTFKSLDPFSLFYYGIVVATPKHSTIKAPFNGEIAYFDKLKGYGNILIIKHSASFFTTMIGINNLYVVSGQKVSKNQIIGRTKEQKDIYIQINNGEKYENPLKWFNIPNKIKK